MEYLLPRTASRRALWSMGFNQVLTSLQTQSYMPVIPLVMTTDMHLPAVWSGVCFFGMVFASLISLGAMTVLIKKYPPRGLIAYAYVLRAFSGVLWIVGTSRSLVLVVLCRFVYGLTLATFTFPLIWVSVKLPPEERPQASAMVMGLLLMGIVNGPIIGDLIAAWLGYSAVGFMTVGLSSIQLAVHLLFFDDHTLLLSSSQPNAKPDDKAVIKLSGLKCFYDFMMGMGLLSGFEATMSLQVRDAYGWGIEESWRAWVCFGAFQIICSLIINPVLLKKLNSAQCATVSFVVSFGSLLGVNWIDLSEPIPAWLFLVDGFFCNAYVLCSMSIQGRIATVVPQEMQTGVNTAAAMAGQLGRAFGPIVISGLYDFVCAKIPGPGTGANFSRVYMMLVAGIPLWLCIIGFFELCFGRFSDSSPEALQRQAGKTALV
ncbi:hypothetical protein AB1Y20_014518 [Prymnesium parvum]|uniref:Major facilitator superfamily (MFS) profile domain-containing protein n=1 Tax=Prymnesium parvum TaxID=97485 RepID=A0AB34IE87_PRYPA